MGSRQRVKPLSRPFPSTRRRESNCFPCFLLQSLNIKRTTFTFFYFVQTQFTFDNLQLESGARLSPVIIAYETFGTLNAQRSNAILICHALTGDAHVADENGVDGWWSDYVGAGKAFDTERYFIICSNVLGGCAGTSGPGTLNSTTAKPYAMTFPVVTVGDMVEAQRRLIDHLGIAVLHCVAGGSMGGMQALEWSTRCVGRARKTICIATSPNHSPQQIAWNEIGRQAIVADPDWNGGEWYGEVAPASGLSVARMIGHITYLSEQSLEEKFARRLQDKTSFSYNFEAEFQIESYLRHQGEKFVARFDANSYLYITRAIDYFDFASRFGSLQAAFEYSKCAWLFVSFSSDWLYPPHRMAEMAGAARDANRETTYEEIVEPHGHDSFLLPSVSQEKAIRQFLRS